MAAWGYTGGKNPYGYMGLGDVFVFVFFGLVATLGTTYTQAGQINLPAIIGAIGTGLIATALLMANNVRDIPTDMQAGKKTLAVRLGDKHARESYVLMLAVAIMLVVILAPGRPWMLIVLLLIPACLMPAWLMINGRKRKSLIPVLKQTGLINLGYSLLFSLGPLAIIGVVADGDIRVGLQEGVLGVRVLDFIGGAERLGLAGKTLVQGRRRLIPLLLEEQVAYGEGDQCCADDGHQYAQLQEHKNHEQGRKESQADQGIFQKGHYSSLAASGRRPPRLLTIDLMACSSVWLWPWQSSSSLCMALWT
jgi:hypothetical protein